MRARIDHALMNLSEKLSTGKRIEMLRALKGISQTDLAKETGTTQAQISRIESGAARRPGQEVLNAIAEYFEVDPPTLNEGNPLPSVLRPEEKVSQPFVHQFRPHPINHLLVGRSNESLQACMAQIANRFETAIIIDSTGRWTTLLEDAGQEVNHIPLRDVKVELDGSAFETDVFRVERELSEPCGSKRKNGKVLNPNGKWTVIELLNQEESLAENISHSVYVALDIYVNDRTREGNTALVLDEGDWIAKAPSFLSLVRQKGPFCDLYLIASVGRSAVTLPPKVLWDLTQTFPSIEQTSGMQFFGGSASLSELASGVVPSSFTFDPERDESMPMDELIAEDNFEGWDKG